MKSRLPILCLVPFALVSCVTPSSSPSSYSPGPTTAARPGNRPGEQPGDPVSPTSTQSSYSSPTPPSQPKPPRKVEWDKGQALMQGFFGATFFEHVSVDGDNGNEVDGDDGDLDQMPLIGGGAQWKLGGDRIDMGAELMFALSGRADAAAFVVGGSGAAVAIDVDMLLVEIYGGPFISKMLGDKIRVYGAAGPVMQFANYHQSGNGFIDDGDGFGTGWYARTGLEFELASRTLLGFGVRWSDTSVDLGGDLGDLEVDGMQAFVSVSRWY